MPRAVLGLGTNLGARRAILDAACTLLADQPGLALLARSRLYETPPLGPPQPDYLNAAVLVEWAGGVGSLFSLTRHLEQLLGRERRERWGARTLDIDLLHWSEGPVHTPELDVPHPQLLSRSFALAPLLDVAPELAQGWGEELARLGGPPALARPGWLEVSAHGDALSVEAGDEGELVSALGLLFAARVEPRPRAVSALPFRIPPSCEQALAALGERMRWAQAGGFALARAVVTHSGGDVLTGVLLGEQRGACGVVSPMTYAVERAVPGRLRLTISSPRRA